MVSPPSKRRLRLVSDLHLFSRRSRADAHLPALREAARAADLFVFAGDTFDYKWASQPCPDSFADEARNWLADFVREGEDCEFRFLLGNHDHHPALMNRLDELAAEHRNFSWDPWFLRHRDAIFLHGDVANGYRTAEELSQFRKRCEQHQRRPGPVRNRIYDALITARLDKCFTRMMFPSRRVAARISRYLDHIGHGPATGTRDVFFGHTHRQLDAFEHEGMRFHNPGAPIKGSSFRIVEAEV